MIMLCVGILFAIGMSRADETVTVTATSSDISENLDLKIVATLFGQAKDLEQFEMMLNNPDSAFSNLDLNGDGEVDYLRVIETADEERHLVVVQAVLAKDIYQDVASIFVDKDESTQSVVVQVIGDEYIYGEDYIIEPVYIYRPLIYDWFWGPSWVCWHSPYYWGYWPGWWRPYFCIDMLAYWNHCHWHHYHYPICSYRTGIHHRPHYRSMHQMLKRNDFATRYPDRSFVKRNALQNIKNARVLEQNRKATIRQTSNNNINARTRVTQTTVNRPSVVGTSQQKDIKTMNRTYGSSNVRTATTSGRIANTSTATRVASTSTATRSAATRGTATRTATTATRATAAPTATRSVSTTRTNTSVATPSRSTTTTVRPTSTAATPIRTAAPTVSRSSSTSVRSSSSMNSTMRSSSAGGSMRSSSSTMRSSGGSSTMRSGSSGGSRTR
jgi:hypothetical protein